MPPTSRPLGNGQRHLLKDGPLREHYADADATRGHRSAISTRNGGSYYGLKIHAAVCIHTGLPVAWRVPTAAAQEGPVATGAATPSSASSDG
jgi:hypothetical protein